MQPQQVVHAHSERLLSACLCPGPEKLPQLPCNHTLPERQSTSQKPRRHSTVMMEKDQIQISAQLQTGWIEVDVPLMWRRYAGKLLAW